MRCPRCNEEGYNPAQPCPACAFRGDPAMVETLNHIAWLLDEMEGWEPAPARESLQRRYTERLEQLKRDLGLSQPEPAPAAPSALSEEEIRPLWEQRHRLTLLLERVPYWQQQHYVSRGATNDWLRLIHIKAAELDQRLQGVPRPEVLDSNAEHHQDLTFLLETIAMLERNRAFLGNKAAIVRASLLAEKSAPEMQPGLRAGPKPAPETPPVPPAPPALTPKPASKPPAVPLGERLWRSLISERTLNAILFLGIFLLLAAAVSFVAWGWQSFPPTVRVLIPTGFTALFFGLGWVIRAKTTLANSGVALSAVAALFIPVDFYTLYVNAHIAPEHAAAFWLLTSLVCLIAYTMAALRIQSRIFGYLVAVAAGSALLAAGEVAGVARDWASGGLSALAGGLILLAPRLERDPQAGGRWRVLAEPFRYVALLTIGVLMPATLAWRYIDRITFDALHYALTLTWALGGLIFAWGAVAYRSRSLGALAAITLPVAVYLGQAALFHRLEVNPAWHAFGWALLVNLYFAAGYRFSRHPDALVQAHGRTANRWGVALLLVAASWSLTDLTSSTAAAASHALLAGAVVGATLLWRRPGFLPGASLLSVTAMTFAMSALNLPVTQVGVGWLTLAILHILAAQGMARRSLEPAPNFAAPLALAGYGIAALALLPPYLPPADRGLLLYSLGNWIALAAWGATLAHAGMRGFAFARVERLAPFQWLAAAPLPLWLWGVFDYRHVPAFSLTLALAALAWGLVALSHRLRRARASYRWPWYGVGLLTSVVAPVVAFAVVPQGFGPALCLLAAGLLYFTDALAARQSYELIPAGLIAAWGGLLLCAWMYVPSESLPFALAAIIAVYFLMGLWAERRRSPVYTQAFWRPLYFTAQALTALAVISVYTYILQAEFMNLAWSDSAQLWGAATQLLLGALYALYAWATYRERWAHAAIWLATAGAGLIFAVYSHGRGSSAAKVALLAAAFVLAERGLLQLIGHARAPRRVRALARLAWRLYRRPLLVAGWMVSAAAIGLALLRNLWLLGGGRTRELWAVAGLWIVTGLYALSARLFQRARFVWLAAFLSFAPWTILTHLGWFFAAPPSSLPVYAFAWTLLAWALLLLGRLMERLATRAYALPLRAAAHLLLPFALLWGVARAPVSRYTYGLAVLFYALEAWRDAHRARASAGYSPLKASRFLYPTLLLLPVWGVYLMTSWLPGARHEHYGLLLLACGPLGLLAGRALERLSPPGLHARTYALPAYLSTYLALIAGTLLTAHLRPLLSLVLLFDAGLLLISARLFREPLWIYPAAALLPASLLFALRGSAFPGNRHGWFLIGLATLYFLATWALRRLRLREYGAALLGVGFALIALGLPPSSRDQIGALWGYSSAALLYAVAAFWLKQPLLLTPACALIVVPYAVLLRRSGIPLEYHGLWLFPGAAAALGWGELLDARLGRWCDFPWREGRRWFSATAERFLYWWALPVYALGYGLATAAPLFTQLQPDVTAWACLLLVGVYGWALYRFRRRLWLLGVAVAGQLTVAFVLDRGGWWQWPAWAWLRFLPVTLATLGAGLVLERRLHEGTPWHARRLLHGWSRPLILLALADLVISQAWGWGNTGAAAALSLTNALLLMLLALFWSASAFTYGSAVLGLVALWQWLASCGAQLKSFDSWEWLGPHAPLLSPTVFPEAVALLALGYGVMGYGLALAARWRGERWRTNARLRAFSRPLQHAALTLGVLLTPLLVWVVSGLRLLAYLIVWPILGESFTYWQTLQVPVVWLGIRVFSRLGLLGLLVAATYRRPRLGYGALALLLSSWILFAFHVQRWSGLEATQWYALPVGLYLILVGYVEAWGGRRKLARWIDYAALLLLLGSLFWQTLVFGWRFALLLGGEGLALLWLGSARRLRRFFYAGMIGVMLAVAGQLINALQSVNQWIVFGIIGVLLVSVGALIERKREQIKTSLEEIFEDWE